MQKHGQIRKHWLNINSIQIPEEVNTKRPNQSPTALYNGMLHPFIGYAIKGAIWYQGEANRNRASEYNALMAALITSWRSQWNQGSFPFYFYANCAIQLWQWNQFGIA